MKYSFITTVYNEEKTISLLLDSLLHQTLMPDEIVIVDGESTDQTREIIQKYKAIFKNRKISLHLICKKGNRSIGRNSAIKKAKGNIILCSDAGNILDKRWVENIIEPFFRDKTNVVAGYYRAKGKTVIEKSIIAYTLVMPDKIDKNNFLPSTRSMAFTKKIWKKVGGFEEKYSHNEDYEFAHRLTEKAAKIIFAENAVVYWIPRTTIKEAFTMFFRFALGDAEANLWRNKVLILFARYLLACYFVFIMILFRSTYLVFLVCIFFILYVIWSISKNYRYIDKLSAIYILPLMQVTSDIAVLSGSFTGLIRRLSLGKLVQIIKSNMIISSIIAIYICILLSLLKWGIPNPDHPFPYHMDEWHQLQAVRETFKNGSPNTSGSANGTMLHFILSGLYLIPFILFHIVNPFAIKSAVGNLLMQERLFEILRLNTIILGVLSLVTLIAIAKRFFTASQKLVVVLFTFTPIWLMLSSYFKYDIDLIFWILLSLFFLLEFSENPTGKKFIIAAIPVGLSISIKISAIPLLLLYVFAFFLFGSNLKKKLTSFLGGIGTCTACILLFGMPDTLFGKGNIYQYAYTNIIISPQDTSNFKLGINPLLSLFIKQYPILFGHGLYILFVVVIIYWCFVFFTEGFKSVTKNKKELFLFLGLFLFILSLLPLKIYAGGNRSLVLLPFIIIIIGLTWQKIQINSRGKNIITIIVACVIFLQVFESLAWFSIKYAPDPQETASIWIVKNIPKKQTLGIENIPIYQFLPDIVTKQFYFAQYTVKQQDPYMYQVIDSQTKILPKFVIITNGEIETQIVKTSAKKSLVQRLKQEQYKKIASFSPDLMYYYYFGNQIDYYFSALVASPLTISVFKK